MCTQKIQYSIYHSTGFWVQGRLSDAFSLVGTYLAETHQGERATNIPWFQNYRGKLFLQMQIRSSNKNLAYVNSQNQTET